MGKIEIRDIPGETLKSNEKIPFLQEKKGFVSKIKKILGLDEETRKKKLQKKYPTIKLNENITCSEHLYLIADLKYIFYGCDTINSFIEVGNSVSWDEEKIDLLLNMKDSGINAFDLEDVLDITSGDERKIDLVLNMKYSGINISNLENVLDITSWDERKINLVTKMKEFGINISDLENVLDITSWDERKIDLVTKMKKNNKDNFDINYILKIITVKEELAYLLEVLSKKMSEPIVKLLKGKKERIELKNKIQNFKIINSLNLTEEEKKEKIELENKIQESFENPYKIINLLNLTEKQKEEKKEENINLLIEVAKTGIYGIYAEDVLNMIKSKNLKMKD